MEKNFFFAQLKTKKRINGLFSRIYMCNSLKILRNHFLSDVFIVSLRFSLSSIFDSTTSLGELARLPLSIVSSFKIGAIVVV